MTLLGWQWLDACTYSFHIFSITREVPSLCILILTNHLRSFDRRSVRMVHCVAVRAICCNLALFPSYYLYCAISLKRCSYVSRAPIESKEIGSDDAFSFECRNLKLLATDERNADENLACVEVR